MCNQTNPWLIDINVLMVYPSSKLYREMVKRCWAKADEIEKYREIRELVRELRVPTGFAVLAASKSGDTAWETAGTARGDCEDD